MHITESSSIKQGKIVSIAEHISNENATTVQAFMITSLCGSDLEELSDFENH